ncbi:toxin-antitoxin system YwqK family antitoxin [Hymenobacter actinosclerus]|uniref:MORN repeat variant n=1 Tax=Hymenobacter actinosclerus TaxID=82805 RepID=A0A1I0IPC9_9BACT|nr:hypothetical protein [Hymenobacter actinosclerus]SET98220.1 hypothetical protein SAMN04487998_3386 [Hymenobacter actinosclerus]
MVKLYSLLLFSSILSLHSAHAQTKTTVPVTTRQDTIYFDHDWERTTEPQDRVYARIARRNSEGKSIGTVRDYFYPSWKKQFEGKVASESPDVATGLCTGWYENGQLHFKGIFAQGQTGSDYREWKEDGKEIKLTYAWQEVLSTDGVKLHSYYNNGSSRQVIPIDLPEGTVGVVYKFDIRDEDQPPVNWTTAITLTAALASAPTGLGPALMLSAGAKALSTERQPAAAVATKCRFFIVDNEELTQPFLAYATKGTMPATAQCYQQAVNRGQETRELLVPAGTKRLYFAAQNDNLRTSAKLKLTVSALVASRQ